MELEETSIAAVISRNARQFRQTWWNDACRSTSKLGQKFVAYSKIFQDSAIAVAKADDSIAGIQERSIAQFFGQAAQFSETGRSPVAIRRGSRG